MLLRLTRAQEPSLIELVVAGAELRAEGDGKPATIVGHGAVFDQVTELWPGYFEVVRRGAFSKTLAEGKIDVLGLRDHDRSKLLCRQSNRSLRLAEDATGLAYEMSPLPDVETVRETVTLLSGGYLSHSSFAFRTVVDRETVNQADGTILREILEAQLYDVSVVATPAYKGAEAGLRAELQLRAASALGKDSPAVRTAILARAAGKPPGAFEERDAQELVLRLREMGGWRGDPAQRAVIARAYAIRPGLSSRAMDDMPAEMPVGVLPIGARVRVRPGQEHDATHTTGTIREISTPAIGVELDAMPGMVHRWYTASELELIDDEA